MAKRLYRDSEGIFHQQYADDQPRDDHGRWSSGGGGSGSKEETSVRGGSGRDDKPKPGPTPHISAHAVGDKLPYVMPSGKLGHAELSRKVPNGEDWRVHNEKGQYVYTSGFKDVVDKQPKDKGAPNGRTPAGLPKIDVPRYGGSMLEGGKAHVPGGSANGGSGLLWK